MDLLLCRTWVEMVHSSWLLMHLVRVGGPIFALIVHGVDPNIGDTVF